jgi:hypothetical protein
MLRTDDFATRGGAMGFSDETPGRSGESDSPTAGRRAGDDYLKGYDGTTCSSVGDWELVDASDL